MAMSKRSLPQNCGNCIMTLANGRQARYIPRTSALCLTLWNCPKTYRFWCSTTTRTVRGKRATSRRIFAGYCKPSASRLRLEKRSSPCSTICSIRTFHRCSPAGLAAATGKNSSKRSAKRGFGLCSWDIPISSTPTGMFPKAAGSCLKSTSALCAAIRHRWCRWKLQKIPCGYIRRF